MRVAKCPKMVVKFKKKKKLAQNTANKPKIIIKVYNLAFIHLEGRKISCGSRDFSDKFLGRQQKKFENPWIKYIFHSLINNNSKDNLGTFTVSSAHSNLSYKSFGFTLIAEASKFIQFHDKIH
jgi:hypothetical protein